MSTLHTLLITGVDPGQGGHEAEHHEEGVRPDLRAEPHLPLRPARRPPPAGVQAQVHRGEREDGQHLSPRQNVQGRSVAVTLPCVIRTVRMVRDTWRVVSSPPGRRVADTSRRRR
jgi:hypothetical protein